MKRRRFVCKVLKGIISALMVKNPEVKSEKMGKIVQQVEGMSGEETLVLAEALDRAVEELEVEV